MSFQFSLQKILEIREDDKIKAEKEFTQATKQFEDVATKLFEQLKKKEQYENEYYKRIETGIHIFEIQHSHTLLNQMQLQIDRQQNFTQKARDNMNRKQEVLVVKSIEQKKYEKMKQIKREKYIEETKHQENLLMDEISVQQFMRKLN
ncbi:flagellar export protein FliJ [Bacillaceae bacterium IKA-2]|nr:flagellar export protein FliJ [Bacillaceae bacterium IKA-2]